MPDFKKGFLIGLDPFNPVASFTKLGVAQSGVSFLYNPDKITRTLTVQAAGSEGSGFSEEMRLKGAPIEKINITIDIGDGTKGPSIYPQLSALEMLIYPKSALVVTNTVLLALGTMEVIPPTGPLVLFIWGGLKRVLPVRLTEFKILEQMFDSDLNPIQAEVDLGMRVLSYNDVPLLHPAYWIFLTHQIIKEVMATQNTFK